MTDQDAEERRFLESARRAWSPTAEDAERVLRAVDRAIALPGAGSFDTAGPRSAAPPQLGWRSAWPHWVLAAALAGGTGALGYGAGFRAGARSVAPSVAPRENPPSAASAKETEIPASAREAPNAAPALERGPEMPARATPASNPSAVAAQKPEASSLDEEVRALRRVERALREQNPRLALALLDELAHEVPRGQLAEERLAAAVQARCALRYGSPAALLEEFAKLHPASAYLTRIRQACAPEGPTAPGANP